MHDFKLSAVSALRVGALRKILLLFVSVFLGSLQPNRIQAWYFTIATVMYITFSFWRNYRKIWFSISNNGVHANSAFFRPFIVSWTSKVLLSQIASAFQGKPAGITLIELDSDGIPTFNKIFLPRAVTVAPEFRDALEKYAPQDHPLWRLIGMTQHIH